VKQITNTRAAIKVLRAMPRNRADWIAAKVEDYAANPALQANNITAWKGGEGIRLRVEEWRVIVLDEIVLAVLEIGPRSGVYR
jgi:mRNA interferase RelE/StbE